jgi:general stress protein 26
MKIHESLLPFLQSQKILSFATQDEKNSPWITNVYYSVNDDYEIFFFSGTDTKHSRHLKQNSEVAYAVVWANPADEDDRKAIQAVGVCEQVKDPIKLAKLLTVHYKYFPDWKDEDKDISDIVKKVLKAGAYVIKPRYIKYWNDEVFGDDSTQEYSF